MEVFIFTLKKHMAIDTHMKVSHIVQPISVLTQFKALFDVLNSIYLTLSKSICEQSEVQIV